MNKLKSRLQHAIQKYGINSEEAYYISFMLSIEIDNKYHNNTIQSYYTNSMEALIEYMQMNEMNPSEARWNKYAVNNGYLSSQTMGYIYGQGFNKLCKEIRKKFKKNVKDSFLI